MGDRGIQTSEAEWWCHFHPLDPALYLYRRQHCMAYIASNRLPLHAGRSRDATITGRGHLVPKTARFIVRSPLSRRYVDGVDWANISNREAGYFRGQKIVLSALRDGAFAAQLGTAITPTSTYEAEIGGWDMTSEHGHIEVKTECVVSSNLFVQTWEHGHNATLEKDGNVYKQKLPGLNEQKNNQEYMEGLLKLAGGRVPLKRR